MTDSWGLFGVPDYNVRVWADGMAPDCSRDGRDVPDIVLSVSRSAVAGTRNLASERSGDARKHGRWRRTNPPRRGAGPRLTCWQAWCYSKMTGRCGSTDLEKRTHRSAMGRSIWARGRSVFRFYPRAAPDY